jgi:hypothetical protein
MKSFLAKALGVHTRHGAFEIDLATSPFIKSGMTTDHIVIIMNHFKQSFLDLGVHADLVDEAMVYIINYSKESSN